MRVRDNDQKLDQKWPILVILTKNVKNPQKSQTLGHFFSPWNSGPKKDVKGLGFWPKLTIFVKIDKNANFWPIFDPGLDQIWTKIPEFVGVFGPTLIKNDLK